MLRQGANAVSVRRFGKTFLDYGTRPLGERLFQADLEAARSAFGVCRCKPEEADADGTCPRGILRFSRHGEEMLLTEYFLPELETFYRIKYRFTKLRSNMNPKSPLFLRLSDRLDVYLRLMRADKPDKDAAFTRGPTYWNIVAALQTAFPSWRYWRRLQSARF